MSPTPMDWEAELQLQEREKCSQYLRRLFLDARGQFRMAPHGIPPVLSRSMAWLGFPIASCPRRRAKDYGLTDLSLWREDWSLRIEPQNSLCSCLCNSS